MVITCLDVVNATYRQLKLIQKNEFELISQNAHTLMEAATSLPAEYTTATHFEHVRLIFEVSNSLLGSRK